MANFISINILRFLSNHAAAIPRVSVRNTGTSTQTFAESKVEKEPDVLSEILEDIREPGMSEEEILLKQNKSRLPTRIYQQFVKKEPTALEAKYDFQMSRLRVYYGRFGRDSKLNPGICWPTKEGIEEMIEYEAMFEPPLQERIKNVNAKKLAEEQEKQAVEDEVDRNMANNDRWIAEHYARIEKKHAKAQELKLQRERLIEDISDYLGYDIDPKDPRFKEAVEQREKEKKKALKVKKQQESYDKMLDKLKKIAEGK